MPNATVLDTSNTTVWVEPVEVFQEPDDQLGFWSPFEDPALPGSGGNYFNNQRGITQGRTLTLRYEDGREEQVMVSAPPWSELGNKGRTRFTVQRV